MSVTPTIGLRQLPLPQYLLRGRRSNAAAQYEELRRLQEQQAALTPLPCGPFRLFIHKRQEEILQAFGKDRAGVLTSLKEGVDVVRVELAEGGGTGKVIGLIDGGKLRVVLGHEPEPITLTDWQLVGIKANLPRGGVVIARLTATWSLFNQHHDDIVAGNAAEVLHQFLDTLESYHTRVRSWQPPKINVGTLVLHVSKKVRQDEAFSEELLDDLFAHDAEIFLVKRLDSRRDNKQGLLLFLPSHQVYLGIFPAPFEDADVGHWLLSFLHTKVDRADMLAQLHVRCLSARQADEAGVMNEDWLDEIDRVEQAFFDWKHTCWQPPQLNGGFFRLRIFGRVREELQQRGISPEVLCAAMNRGLDLYKLVRESDVLVTVPEGLECQIQLTPYEPSIGSSDWRLISLRKADATLPAFARIMAQWQEGVWGQPSLSGDAPQLLRDLDVLQKTRQEVDLHINMIKEQIVMNTHQLSERITYWKKICEIERDMLQVGITHLNRDGDDFVLVPEEQDTVEEWIENLESLNQEGIDWERYPLELRVGEDHARLIVRAVTVAQSSSGELVLRVRCDHPLGRALIDKVCDSVAMGEGVAPEDIQLFLPDTQLRLIDTAIALLDPDQKTRSEKIGIVGDDLALDDLSVRTLRRILATPNELEPLTAEWPPLPIRPLAPLSPRQEEAVRAAIFGPDMTLIQGPPGTGKTTVILEILRQLFRLHGKNPSFKVLLVAPTHVAVDNVLERLVTSRGGSHLVMELGVAPYRLGSTRRIAEHLRGFTPDCLNTEYRNKLEKEVASALAAAVRDCERDRLVRELLEDGAACDAVSWWCALQFGEVLDLGPWDWPPALEAELPNDLNSQHGRVRVWRDWRARGARPEERVRLLQRWLDFVQQNPRFFSELLLANANLVCATTVGCATHRELRSVIYDYVIVDEAGKEETRRLLVPLIRGERWILVGDHQQLPPYADDALQARLVREGLDPHAVTRSLFEELQEPFERSGRYIFLDRQGRMHPDISAFVSERFYGGRLQDFPHTAEHTMPTPPFLPHTPNLLVLDTRQLPDRYETRRGTGYINLLEQELAVFILRAFAELAAFKDAWSRHSESNSSTIGVIAPYRRQVEEIERQVRRDPRLQELLCGGILQVGTVDSFQGQERDLIIFCCTRSNSQGRLGFVDNRQRLNVALSRARCRLIVLADGQTIEQARFRSDLSDIEVETRDHLYALFAFARCRRGILEVPEDWRTRWRE